ncbi:MAG: arginine deiminase family protein [Pseudomonadota bacterium]
MLNIRDETSSLTDLCICRGTAVPPCETYRSDHPEFETFPMRPWNPADVVAQQDHFHAVLANHGVRLHFIDHSDAHPWQMYTRDTGFVVGDKLFFSRRRELPERDGEIDVLRTSLPALAPHMVEITAGRIEGGDVMPDGDVVFVGLGTRTDPEAAEELGSHASVHPIALGPTVMHLDTRMTILPGRRALIHTDPFPGRDLTVLKDRFRLIEVTADEAVAMATNVFVINPETVVVHAGFPRIIEALRADGLNIVPVDFSGPNALNGSFRCATMPLARA